jgi:hypothetical protein
MFSKSARLSAILLLVLPTAQAHHSGAAFDNQQPVTLNGVVKVFQWTNPHCYIQVLVRDAQGSETEWSLEMASPVYLYNLGWRPSTLKPGSVITATVLPLRNGEKGGLVREVLDAEGKSIGRKP